MPETAAAFAARHEGMYRLGNVPAGPCRAADGDLLVREFGKLRAAVDRVLAPAPAARARDLADPRVSWMRLPGAYPRGACEEITRLAFLAAFGNGTREEVAEVFRTVRDSGLSGRDDLPADVSALLSAGAQVRARVAGILGQCAPRRFYGQREGRHFQWGVLAGPWMLDVAGDAEGGALPPVTAAPVLESGLREIEDWAHFAEVAWNHWGARAVPNVYWPLYAPALPLVLVDRDGMPSLENTAWCAHAAADGFESSRRFLESSAAVGPLLDPELVRVADEALAAKKFNPTYAGRGPQAVSKAFSNLKRAWAREQEGAVLESDAGFFPEYFGTAQAHADVVNAAWGEAWASRRAGS